MTGGVAAQRWRELQQGRGLPPEILAGADVSPWRHDPTHFAAPATPDDTPSRDAALALLGAGIGSAGGGSEGRGSDCGGSDGGGGTVGGTVLDVGCGGGAASLALGTRAQHLTGVDHDPGMLEVFSADCAARGIEHRTVLGEWPEVADEAGTTDVVLCHHVGYNTVEFAPFLLALSAAARRGVVMELTAWHPMSWLDPLWERFHDLYRPPPASADDAVAVLAELGITPTVVRWERPARLPDDPVWVARRLCLPATRADEVAAALAGVEPRPRAAVTLHWSTR